MLNIMSVLHVTSLVLLVTAGLVVWRLFTSYSSSKAAPLPPGPPADPIIGHLRIVPTSRPELTYQKWAKEYNSDVLYLNFMGQPAIILNSLQAANDLMDKRGTIYSDRPRFHFMEESGWRDSVAFSSTGPIFRKHRKAFQSSFSPTAIVRYREKQEDLARKLVGQIIERPEQWRLLLTRFSSSVVLSIAYGIRIESDQDPFLLLAEKIAWIFANGGPPGATMVDIFPVLRKMPSWVKIFPSLNFARSSYYTVQEFRNTPFEWVKKEMANGSPGVSFTRKMLEELQLNEEGDDADKFTEDDIKGAAGTMYAAGADTTLSTLIIFILCMVLNPEAQEKGRKEIDRMTGRDRLPNLSDRGSMPYIDLLVYETLR